jgi:hypothetical protein
MWHFAIVQAMPSVKQWAYMISRPHFKPPSVAEIRSMLERPVRTTPSGAQDAASGWAADPSIEIKRPIIGSLWGWYFA